MSELGIQPIVANWTHRYQLSGLPNVDRVLIAVGWDRSGVTQYDNYVLGLRNVLNVVPDSSNLVYISSTGVYHQCDGSWVDERSTSRPTVGSGGWAHLKAEQLLQSRRQRSRTTVLRLAGLYGPGRVPRIKSMLNEKAVAVPTSGYLNLIHLNDATEAVLRAWDHARCRSTYVVSDGNPVIRRTYYEEICSILKADPPQFVDPKSTSRPITNKRVWTAKLRRCLMPAFDYPDYKAGLRSILLG